MVFTSAYVEYAEKPCGKLYAAELHPPDAGSTVCTSPAGGSSAVCHLCSLQWHFSVSLYMRSSSSHPNSLHIHEYSVTFLC